MIYRSLLLCLIGFYGCFPDHESTIIYEKKDSKGRVYEHRISGYYSGEGEYIKTERFDTNGRRLLSYGIMDGDRFTESFTYSEGSIITNTYLTHFNDQNLDRLTETDSIDFLRISEYYKNGNLKYQKYFSKYESWNHPDTADLNEYYFDLNKDTVSGFSFRKDRKYNKDSIVEYVIFCDFITDVPDTISVKTFKSD